MATQVSTADKVYVGAFDVGPVRSAKFGDVTVAAVDFTSMADAGWLAFKPGLVTAPFEVEVFQDFATTGTDATLGTMAARSTITYSQVGATTQGDAVYFTRGYLTGYQPWAGAVGEAAMSTLMFSADAAPVRGALLHPAASRSSTGNGTTYAFAGPTTSQKLYAAIHVTAYSGLTNAVIKIQSDDNSGMSSATDRLTFSTITGTTNELSSVAGYGATETHHRVVYTLTGVGSLTFVVSIGIA